MNGKINPMSDMTQFRQRVQNLISGFLGAFASLRQVEVPTACIALET